MRWRSNQRFRCSGFAAIGSVLLAAFAACVYAQDAGDRPFDFRSDAAFANAEGALQEFLRDRHVRSSKVQHFCIVGYQNASEERAWVYWTEGQQIILWHGAADPPSAASSIARSQRAIDLKKDVVTTEADIKGSTYLVARAWVDHLLADCQSRGERYAISLRQK